MKRFVIVFLWLAAVCAMTSVEAAAIDLAPGDLVVADLCNKKLVRVDPVSGTQTLIYSGAFQPRGVAFGADGDLLITDKTVNEGAVIRIDRATGAESIVSSGGELARGQLLGIALDPDGQIIVAAPGGEFQPAIIRVDPVTGAQTLLAEGYTVNGAPTFVAVAPDGTIYFSTGGNPLGSIWRIAPGTGAVSLVSAGGLIQSTGGIAVEASGMLVVADYDSDTVLRIDPETGAQAIVSLGGLLQGHIGLALEADGHILVADTPWQGGGIEVIRIDPMTGAQSIVASDGLLSDCSSMLSVVPLQFPLSLTATPNLLWPPNHTMVPVLVTVSASDGSSDAPLCQITAVNSNEPMTVPGESDWAITRPLTVRLRAERAASGHGRVYAITVTCTNAARLSATNSVTVTVPHDHSN